MVQSHITAVWWHERDEGLRHSLVISATQVLTVGVFQDPRFYPQVLAITFQRVSRQIEPEENGRKRKEKLHEELILVLKKKMTHPSKVNFEPVFPNDSVSE